MRNQSRPGTAARRYRRPAVLAAVVGGLGLVAGPAVSASGTAVPAAAVARSAAKPSTTAPTEMHALDFLLGNWKCTTTVAIPGEPATVSTVYGHIYPVLGGNWYEWDAHRLPSTSLPTELTSHWLFGGWDATSATFTTIYYDDGGNHGQETSIGSGWVAGNLKFTGSFTSPAGAFTYVDDFTVSGGNQFTDTISVEVSGTSIQAGTGVCDRI